MSNRISYLAGLLTFGAPWLLCKSSESVPDPNLLPLGAAIPTLVAQSGLLVAAMLSVGLGVTILWFGDRTFRS